MNAIAHDAEATGEALPAVDAELARAMVDALADILATEQPQPPPVPSSRDLS